MRRLHICDGVDAGGRDRQSLGVALLEPEARAEMMAPTEGDRLRGEIDPRYERTVKYRCNRKPAFAAPAADVEHVLSVERPFAHDFQDQEL